MAKEHKGTRHHNEDRHVPAPHQKHRASSQTWHVVPKGNISSARARTVVSATDAEINEITEQLLRKKDSVRRMLSD